MPTDKLRKLLEHPTWDTSPLLNSAKSDTPTYPHPFNLPPTEKAIVDADGRVIGEFRPTGAIPTWFDQLAGRGIRCDPALFDPDSEVEVKVS